MKEKYIIKSGPTKETFMKQFFKGSDLMDFQRSIKFPVTFEKWKPSTIILNDFKPDDPHVYLRSIERIEKNPDQFNFIGIRVMPSSSQWSKEVHGFYDCNQQTGWYEDLTD
jgi:hypothetical protein